MVIVVLKGRNMGKHKNLQLTLSMGEGDDIPPDIERDGDVALAEASANNRCSTVINSCRLVRAPLKAWFNVCSRSLLNISILQLCGP